MNGKKKKYIYSFQTVLGSHWLWILFYIHRDIRAESSWFQVAVVTITGRKLSHADVDIFTKTWRFGSFFQEIVSETSSPAALLTRFHQITEFPYCCLLLSSLSPCSCCYGLLLLEVELVCYYKWPTDANNLH